MLNTMSVECNSTGQPFNNDDNDDDVPKLSAATLAALQEFYAEKVAEQEQSLNTDVEEMPKEDWQLSQFWYDERTAEMLAQEALAVAKENGRIACVSCPSVYLKLRELKSVDCRIYCLEYDSRFEKYQHDFVYYDYNDPLNLPKQFEKSFDIVIADPPFLSEDCLRKTTLTIDYLAKQKIILCTGAVMEDLAQELLGVKPCLFKPSHSNNLGNEFQCYVNYKTVVLNLAC